MDVATPRCEGCGSVGPLGPPADEDLAKLTVWASRKLQVARLVGADVRIYPLPANSGEGPIPSNLRLIWKAVDEKPSSEAKLRKIRKQKLERARKEAEADTDAAMADLAAEVNRGNEPQVPAPETPPDATAPTQGPSSSGDAAAAPPGEHGPQPAKRKVRSPSRPPLAARDRRMRGTILARPKHALRKKVMVRLVPRAQVQRPVAPPAPKATAPVLFLTTGNDHSLAKLLGARRVVSCLALNDQLPMPELQGCTGDSGFVLHRLVHHRDFRMVLAEAVGVIVAEQARPGGAVVHFACKSGRHRSVGMARLLSEVLGGRHGLVVETRHLGDRHKRGSCTCPAPMCKEVAWRTHPEKGWTRGERRAMLSAEHEGRHWHALEEAAPIVRDLFTQAGLALP